MKMFEWTPFRFAIGTGWFEDQPGFDFEIELLTLSFHSRPRYLHGSLFAFYVELWKEDGKIHREINWDFLYLNQFFKRRKKNGIQNN